MSDLIDRQVAIDLIDEQIGKRQKDAIHSAYEDGYDDGLRATKVVVKCLPIVHPDKDVPESPGADVRENVHAHWVKVGQFFLNPNKFLNYACSKCGFDIEQKKFRFCPNCGAQMDERREE